MVKPNHHKSNSQYFYLTGNIKRRRKSTVLEVVTEVPDSAAVAAAKRREENREVNVFVEDGSGRRIRDRERRGGIVIKWKGGGVGMNCTGCVLRT